MPSSSTPPWSSSPLPAQDHGDACDGDERSSPSGIRAPPRLSSRAPSSRLRPSADDRDHLGATSLGASGPDRSSASSSPWRCCRATTGSRSGLPVEPSHGSPSRGFAVSASAPPCRRQIHERAMTGKANPTTTARLRVPRSGRAPRSQSESGGVEGYVLGIVVRISCQARRSSRRAAAASCNPRMSRIIASSIQYAATPKVRTWTMRW